MNNLRSTRVLKTNWAQELERIHIYINLSVTTQTENGVIPLIVALEEC